MILHGTPIVFSQSEILKTAVFLQIRVSEILEASSKIFTISSAEYSLIIQHSPPYFGNVYCFNDLIYVSSVYEDKPRLLIIAYLLLQDDKTSILSVVEMYDSFNSALYHISRYADNYNDSIASNYRELNVFAGYKKWDMDAFIKVARKYKAVAEMVGDQIAITFKNVKCGNETEGYIQYKSIQCFLEPRSKKPNRFIYTFNKFFWDSAWGSFVGLLHPHISSNNLCLGNRDEDYRMYVLSHSYPFMLELLKESMNAYSPDGPPYCAVNLIRQKLAVLNQLIDVKLQADGKKSLHEVNDPRQWLDALRRDNRCSHCSSMIIGNTCSGVTCDANPEFVGNCGNCGRPMVIDAWDGARRTYPRTCNNVSCEQSPNYVGLVDIPYCRICGSTALRDNMACSVDGCRGERWLQWRQSTTGRYSAVRISGVGIPTLAELTAQREGLLSGIASEAIPRSAYFCPNCSEELTIRPSGNYGCDNMHCRGYNQVYFTPQGQYILSARMATCPECEDELEYRDGEGFFCVNDECENYNSLLIHNDGGSATPF